jgi:hypothetical protein
MRTLLWEHDDTEEGPIEGREAAAKDCGLATPRMTQRVRAMDIFPYRSRQFTRLAHP